MDNIEIRVIDLAHKKDINIPNEPFAIFGRMIPAYDGTQWSYTTELLEETGEECFPDENYQFEEMPDCVFIGAYEGERCVGAFQDVVTIESSQGEDDVRYNYIIDKKYVLRINSAKVMTEKRIRKINDLVKRYNDFGLKAPYFLSNNAGTYVFEYKDLYWYLSEYLDYEIADHVKSKCRKELIKERVILVAKFANRYKNIDLTEIMSMYSLFELSPYDQLTGIDEKQDNFNTLIHDLEDAKESGLAGKLKASYNYDRKELLSFYKELPRCVFQGDENFSNLCVDEKKSYYRSV